MSSPISATSAASSATAVPARPMAMPTVAFASAGRVVDAVADHSHLAVGPTERLHRLHFLLRQQVGPNVVDPDLAAHGSGDVLVVAREHHDGPHARAREGLRAPRARSRAAGRQCRTRQASGRRCAPRRCSAPPPAASRPRCAPRAGCPPAHPPHPQAADLDHLSVHLRPHATRGDALERRRVRQLQTGIGGVPDDGLGQRMLRLALHRGGHAQQFVPGPPRSRTTSVTCGTPVVSVPVLSTARALIEAEVLEMDPAFHEHAMPCGLRDAGQHGGRRAQRQRTWRGRHQQGHAAIEADRPVPDAEQRGDSDEQHVADQHDGHEDSLEAARSAARCGPSAPALRPPAESPGRACGRRRRASSRSRARPRR